MAEINPDADDPFEVLGVPPDTPLQEIRDHATTLVKKHDMDEAVRAIGEAVEEIEEGMHVKEVGETRVEPLVVDATPATVEYGESVTVTVTDITGKPVEDATIKVGEATKAHTSEDGEADVEVDDIGSQQLQAIKSHPKEEWEYASGTVEISVERRERILVFRSCPETATTGEPVEVKVTDGNGTGQHGVRIKGPKSEARTRANGKAEITLETVGEDIELEASKSTSTTQEFRSVTATLDVHEREVELGFDEVPEEVSYGSSQRVRVVDQQGSGVREAAVTITDTDVTERTDADGRVTLSFEDVTPGPVRIEASKQNRGGEVFEEATTEVTVTPKEIELAIEPLEEDIQVDDPATFNVTNQQNEPVQGAIVTTDGSGIGFTDENGNAAVIFDRGGKNRRVRASKHDSETPRNYRTDSISVSVQRRTEQLRFTSVPEDATADDLVEVRVGAGQEDDVGSVTVTAEDGSTAKTNDDGYAYLKFFEPGDKEVTAERHPTASTRYKRATATVSVRESQKLQFTSLPSKVSVDDGFEVQVGSDTDETIDGVTLDLEGGTTTTTDETGRGYVRFTEFGRQKIRAEKEDSEDIHYAPAVETVTVQPIVRHLRFELAPDTGYVGDTVEFKICDETGPVGGVYIESDDGTECTTGFGGEAVAKFQTRGERTLEARKSSGERISYEAATTTIKIKKSLGIGAWIRKLTRGLLSLAFFSTLLVFIEPLLKTGYIIFAVLLVGPIRI